MTCTGRIVAGVRYLLPALMVMTPWIAGAVEAPPQGLWGSQAVADTSEWGFSYATHTFANGYDLALQHGRFPLVVYTERATSGYTLKSVEWRNGTRKEQTIFPVEWGSSGVRLAAQGDRVSATWATGVQSTGWVTIWHSLRVNGVWSPAETVASGYYAGWDVGMTSAGTPVMAVKVPGSDTSNSSKIRWMVRGTSGWTGTEIASLNRPVSNIELTLDPSGEPTVAWRAYSNYTGGPPEQVQYAKRAGGQWIQRDIAGATLLGHLFNGGTGEPCAIFRYSSSSVSWFVSLAEPGATPEPITALGGDVTGAAASPDGTIHAMLGDSLIVRRDGVWSEAPCPWSQKLVTGSDGAVHILGESNGMLNYGTLLPGAPTPFQPLTTYADGSAVFDDVVMHPDGQPRVFGWLGGTRKYSRTGNSWSYQTVPTIGFDWLHAFDRAGKLHAFAGSGHYAIEQSNGTITTSNLPVSVTSMSSSSIYAFLLDSADVPHVGFYTGLGTASSAVRYGVKRNGIWTIETVAAGEISDQHCSLSLDPAGNPWMFTSRGLFRRNSGTGSWTQEYVTSGVTYPGLGIASDGTVHAVFRYGERWRSLTGKDGGYVVDDIDWETMPNTEPSFAMAGDRPLLAYGTRLSYYPTLRHAIVLAEKTGGIWRQRHLTPRGWKGELGERISLAAKPNGQWTIAGVLMELQNHTYNHVMFVCQGELPSFEPAANPLVHSQAPDGRHLVQVDLAAAPFAKPLVLESSASLATWTPLLDLGPALRIHPGVEGVSIQGDPFRTNVMYELPANGAAGFVRFKGSWPD